MKEKEGHRERLWVQADRLDEYFPGKEILTIKDVSEYTGYGYRYAKKKFMIGSNGISKIRFASLLCEV